MQVRVGLDLVEVERVAESVSTFGDRYLRLVYTDRELRDCGLDPADGRRPNPAETRSLAARFAAKEATLKALDAPDGNHWQSIEVCREPGRAPTLELRGDAAAIARQRGISQLAVSLTHESTMAAAVVVVSIDEGGA